MSGIRPLSEDYFRGRSKLYANNGFTCKRSGGQNKVSEIPPGRDNDNPIVLRGKGLKGEKAIKLPTGGKFPKGMEDRRVKKG